MNNNHLSFFEIQSSDPQREISFYEQCFGWKFTRDTNMDFEFFRIEGSGIGGALLARPAKVPPPEHGTNAFACSIQVESFDRTADTIKKLGGRVALPKFPIPGMCWQGYFLDPDNNVFGIFELDTEAA